MSDLLTLLSSIRWQDVIDITLNSYIIFRLYVLFRGTNVFRVIMGLAFLWFFQRVAVSLGLIVTSWAIQGITAVAAFIIIVVFRNEIRSVLQARKLKAILWGFSHKAASTPIESIVEGVFDLARRHSGALIVLPGKEDLSEVVQRGMRWRGWLSKEMIVSIFWPDNPVHDGAAVIQGDRVMEVGVILPLSHRQDLPSHYGTRHRAAAGLAENTDALVILVSEENGHVVVAKGSRLRVIHGKEQLERLLQEHVGVTAPPSGYPRKTRLQLGVAALVSVLFITGVWFSFTWGLYTLITLEVPIEYMNRDPGMELLETSVNAVRLDLSGSGALIKSVRPEQVHVRLDLSEAVVGRHVFNITPENVSLPPGVLLRAVKPPAVEVTLDVPIKKELPIQVDWAGKLPKHVILSGVKLDPEKIQVVGGSRILENISTIYTEKVALDKIEKTGTVQVKLVLNPASLRTAPGSDDTVTLTYLVNERPE